MRRDVESAGVDASLAQELDEQARAAAGVEHPPRPDGRDNAVGDWRKEAQPVLVFAIRPANVMKVVVFAEVEVAQRRGRRIGLHKFL